MSVAEHAKFQSNILADRRSLDRKFFMAYAFAGIAAVFVGFARTYYLRGYTDAPPLSALVQVHAIIFTLWMVLFAVQTSLVATKRVSLHRSLGYAAIGFAVVMVAAGLMAGLIGARDGWTGPRQVRDAVGGLSFMIVPIGDMLIFGSFFAGAVIYRRQPDLHKRLMILAMCGSIMPPAFARLPTPVALTLGFAFLLAGPIYDRLSRGRIHSVYKWGAPLIAISIPLRQIVGATEGWHNVARWLLQITG
jgi:hypothetical protein